MCVGEGGRLICKRRFVPTVSLNDEVFPCNIGALKHGLPALNYEDQGDIERSRASWGMALELLQGDLKQERGGELAVARRSGFGVGKIRMRLQGSRFIQAAFESVLRPQLNLLSFPV